MRGKITRKRERKKKAEKEKNKKNYTGRHLMHPGYGISGLFKMFIISQISRLIWNLNWQ